VTVRMNAAEDAQDVVLGQRNVERLDDTLALLAQIVRRHGEVQQRLLLRRREVRLLDATAETGPHGEVVTHQALRRAERDRDVVPRTTIPFEVDREAEDVVCRVVDDSGATEA